MRAPVFRLLAAATLLMTGLTGLARAQLLGHASVGKHGSLLIMPVMVLEGDNRRALEEFAAEHKLSTEELRRSHAASGLVECGSVRGAGQLTLATTVITTAAHVFFDEQGGRRGEACYFIAEIDGEQHRIPIDMTSIIAGATQPYAVEAVHDWAVAKLSRPIDGVLPYDLASDVSVNELVEFVARGHSDWGDGHHLSFEDCALRQQTNAAGDGVREFAFDCDTGDGASGGAVLLGDKHRRLGAILVGWRSNNPRGRGSFSASHYNFVLSVEGAFRRAVLQAAMKDADGTVITSSNEHTNHEAVRANFGAAHRSAGRR